MSRHRLRPALRHFIYSNPGVLGYNFDAGTLAGEIERLTASGDSTLTVDGESLPIEATILSGNQTISADTDYGDATDDDRMTVVKVDGDLTIDATYTVSTAARKLGLCLYVDGDLTVNGTIDMTGGADNGGANHSAATGSNIAPFAILVANDLGATDGIVPAAGGAGGAYVLSGPGNDGAAGTNGGTGGGGSGAGLDAGSDYSGAGSAGTVFSGGTGGGATRQGSGPAGTGGGIHGGRGGDAQSGASGPAAGGSGNPGGTGVAGGNDGNDGTGGLIIIICEGNVTIGAAGIISANGVDGGDAGLVASGATGGGSINIYHSGTYTNSGTVQANGGTGGDGFTTYDGGNGGAGDIREVGLERVTLELQPDETDGIDARISETASQVTYNYGTSGIFYVGWTASDTAHKGLIKFDLSSLPAGAVVASATLSLYCDSELSTTDRNVYVHRSLVEWYEGIKNGAAPGAEDGSTWNHRNANTGGQTAWAGGAGGVGGTEYEASATDTVSITGPSTWFEWDVSVDVAAWVSGAATNYGFWLIGQSTNSSWKRFASSGNGTAANRPKLTITYDVPV